MVEDKGNNGLADSSIVQKILHLNPYIYLLTCIIILAVILVFLNIGEKSFWLDEALSYTVAHADWPEFWQAVFAYEANQVFYFLFLKFWLIFGDSEFWLRSLSALFALGAVVITYVLGKHLFGRRVGIVAALLITINAFFIAYAQETRGYMLALLLGILSTYFFIRAIEKSGWKWWAVYVLVIVLGVYSHIYVTLLLVAQFISLIFLSRREIPWKGLVISGFSILVLLIPMAYFILTRDMGQIGWVTKPGPEELVQVFHHLTGRGEYLSAIVYFILCIVALSVAVRLFIKQRLSPELWLHALVLCCLFLPIIISFMFSYIKPIFFYRFFFMFVPFLVIYVALGIIYLRRRWLILATIAILLVISIFPLKDWYTGSTDEEFTHKEDWREVVSYITTSAGPNDAILFFYPHNKLPYDYYFNQIDDSRNTPTPVHYYSDEVELNIYQLPGDIALGRIAPNPDSSITDRLSGYDNIWLVEASISSEERRDQRQMLHNTLQEEYGIPQERVYDDPVFPITVYYFTSAE